jgi:hypothetical protein
MTVKNKIQNLIEGPAAVQFESPDLKSKQADVGSFLFNGDKTVKTIDYVYATRLETKNGKFKGYRYTAVRIDKSEEVIRQCATRLYDNAFLYEGRQNNANDPAIWSFGKKSQTCYGNLKASFPVTTFVEDADPIPTAEGYIDETPAAHPHCRYCRD